MQVLDELIDPSTLPMWRREVPLRGRRRNLLGASRRNFVLRTNPPEPSTRQTTVTSPDADRVGSRLGGDGV